ncbi:unnamed protein product [Lactuca virosa]|uniref:Uncharacterized protein n=1 Tax=Lactuca virosa TaxID=75947 RepID=A0AAU9LIS2_9ASTR|nr:unnamed protein product [Lactuca virosa]
MPSLRVMFDKCDINVWTNSPFIDLHVSSFFFAHRSCPTVASTAASLPFILLIDSVQQKWMTRWLHCIM